MRAFKDAPRVAPRMLPAMQPGHAKYGIHERSKRGFDETVARVRETLAAEGFGVLTEIDMQATMKKKLDADFPRFVILGACNPPLANAALTAQPDIALLLPCNVVVRETHAGIEIAALNPDVLFAQVVQDPTVAPVAKDATARLARALKAASQ